MNRSESTINFQLLTKEEIDEKYQLLFSDLENEKNILSANKKITSYLGSYFGLTRNFKNITLYRVTRIYTDLEKKIDYPTSFMNPESKDSKLGRANLQGFPVFYASLNPQTAIDEANLTDDEEFYLSKWKVINHLSAFKFILDSKKRNGFLESSTIKDLNRLLQSSSLIEKENFIYKQKKITDLFTEVNNNQYKISSKIAHFYIYSELFQNTPSIVYPSVKKLKDEYNFAIHPNFVKDKNEFQLQSVQKLKKNKGEKNFTFSSTGLCENDKINWGKILLKVTEINLEEIEIVSSKKKIKINSKNCFIEDSKGKVSLFQKLESLIDNKNVISTFTLFDVLENDFEIEFEKEIKFDFQQKIRTLNFDFNIKSVHFKARAEIIFRIQ